jgi:hypothetical protein
MRVSYEYPGLFSQTRAFLKLVKQANPRSCQMMGQECTNFQGRIPWLQTFPLTDLDGVWSWNELAAVCRAAATKNTSALARASGRR